MFEPENKTKKKMNKNTHKWCCWEREITKRIRQNHSNASNFYIPSVVFALFSFSFDIKRGFRTFRSSSPEATKEPTIFHTPIKWI